MKYRTLYNYGATKANSSGSMYREKYVRSIDELSGEKKIVSAGKENVYESIQLAAKGQTVPELVARASRGDSTAIGPDIGSYADLTNAPKNLLEAQNLIIKAKSEYEKLPIEIKQKYGNNCRTWLEAVNDGRFVKTCIEDAKQKAAIDKLKKEAAASKAPLSDEQVTYIRNLINTNNGG